MTAAVASRAFFAMLRDECVTVTEVCAAALSVPICVHVCRITHSRCQLIHILVGLRECSVALSGQAFWIASQAIKVQCLAERKGKAQEPVMPSIISMHVAELPDNSSIPEPAPMQVCFRSPQCANGIDRNILQPPWSGSLSN